MGETGYWLNNSSLHCLTLFYFSTLVFLSAPLLHISFQSNLLLSFTHHQIVIGYHWRYTAHFSQVSFKSLSGTNASCAYLQANRCRWRNVAWRYFNFCVCKASTDTQQNNNFTNKPHRGSLVLNALTYECTSELSLPAFPEGPDLTFEELSNAISLYSASHCLSFLHLSLPNTVCIPFIRTACITLLNGCPCQWFTQMLLNTKRYSTLNISLLINRLLGTYIVFYWPIYEWIQRKTTIHWEGRTHCSGSNVHCK